MHHYPKAAKGIHMLFLSIILAMLTPIITAAVPAVGLGISIGCVLLQIAALYIASADHSGYRPAFYVSIASLALNIVSMFLLDTNLAEIIATSLVSLLSLFVICQVITVTSPLIEAADPNAPSKGESIRKVFAATTIINVVCSFLQTVPVFDMISFYVLLGSTIVQLANYIRYMIYLNHACRALA